MATASHLSTQVELHLKCLGLPKLDLLSKSDPFAVVYVKEGTGLRAEWREIFRTSTISNNSNPEWSDHIVLEFHFEVVQELRFEVYDRDSKSEKLSAHDFIGAYETSMSKIMGSRGCTVSGPVVNPKKKRKNPGKIIVSAQEISTCADVLTLQLAGSSLDRKNFFGLGKSDPFFEIHQMQSDGSFTKVFTSDTIKSTLNPVWKKYVLPVQRICNGDRSRPLRFDVFDWESNGKHQYIGTFSTTLDQLMESQTQQLINDRSKKKKKSSGTIKVSQCTIEERHSFLEFVRGGCEINLTVAIDFTASNGHPLDEISLHRLPQQFAYTGSMNNLQQLNQYQSAIWAVGRILEDYDHDKQIPVYGFGGQFNGTTSHCFPLTFDERNPKVHGVEGIMGVYQTALNTINLSGPTYFAPVINKTLEAAKEGQRSAAQKYQILLILTDGIINDMDATVRSIVNGSTLPLSIIIVGVGNADFSSMETLDGDDVKLSYMGKETSRDIVQFVPFAEFRQKGVTALAEEVLREVPEQLTSYFASKNERPSPPRDASNSHMKPYEDDADLPVAEVVAAEPYPDKH